MPEATMCQSFTAWKKMGRYVKKGEHGIKILAPAPFKVKAEHLVKDDVTGKNLLDENGKEITEEKLIDVMGFKVVYTFDVSQTEGEPIPTLGVDELKGNVEMYPEYIEILESISPCAISFMDYKGESKGYYSPSKNHIVIKDNLSELQTLKTLIHEMSHAVLHNDEAMKERTIDSSQMEIEAESVAYTVCSYLGLDTSEYSFSYVAGWSKGKDISELKDSLSLIKTAASDMITKIEAKLEKKLVKEESVTPEEPEIDNEEEIERAVM